MEAMLVIALSACREADLSGLRVEIHEVLGNRNITDEQFKVGLLGGGVGCA